MDGKKKFDGLDLCALWKNQGQGWGGNLGGLRVLMFENTKKKNPAEPDYRLYVVKNEKRDKPAATEEAREPGSDDVTTGDEPF